GHGLTPQLATRLVEGLFEARFIDQPLVPVKVRMPAHEGFQLDSTTQRGEMRTRWFVWPCPVSKRILIVDANESLQAGTPPELMAWMEQMARTVRCHVDARVERFGHLSRLNEIEGADISHAYPRMWAPIQGYRVQKNFAGADFAVAASGPVTAEKGQWLTLASDSSMRLFLSWGPPIDEPMSYEILSQRVQDHWRERSLDVMQLDSLAVGDVWINNGIVRFGPLGKPIPPTPLHKYRAWDWQRDGVAYFAVADIGGVRHGRRDAPQAHETWNRLLEQLFETIRIAPAGAD
ncbi:MAG TPA: hypothetical protein VFP98_06070, partial [Candidatus Polarisedimenticolia bacterium]|nr:hypothetical protein [Candidatus Polarisedimenticolia bacterium]